MSTALITGATGFIGGHLVRANLTRGRRVRALVLPGDPGAPALEAAGAEVCTGDVRDFPRVRDAVNGAEVIFHCAAVVSDWAPRTLFKEVTVGGTENVCRAAAEARVGRLVGVSTNDVFGLDEARVLEETCPLRPWGEPYPDAKIAAERVMWRYHRERTVPLTMVYPCWVYGPGDRAFVPLLGSAIVRRELVFWRRDALVWPTYIDNLVDVLLLIAEDRRAVGNGYLVHDGKSTTLQAFCARLARALGVPPVNMHIPYALAYAAALVLEAAGRAVGRTTRPLLTTYTVRNLGSRLRFSIAKARRELGWRPPLSHAKGMERTLAWLATLDRDTLGQE